MASIHFNLFVQLEAIETEDNGDVTWADLGWAVALANGDKINVARAIANLPAKDVSNEDLNTAILAMKGAEDDFNDAIADRSTA
jgi:hypothetical protein